MIAEIVCAAIGLLLLVLFLGIIVWWVKALPLAIIALGVITLVVYDQFLTLRENENKR